MRRLVFLDKATSLFPDQAHTSSDIAVAPAGRCSTRLTSPPANRSHSFAERRVGFSGFPLQSGQAAFGQIAPKAVEREWRLLTKRTLRSSAFRLDTVAAAYVDPPAMSRGGA